MNGSHEFGIATQPLFYDKAQVLQYTHTIYNTLDIFTSRIPVKLPPYQNIFRPFPFEVWVGLLVVTVICSITFVVIQRTYRHLDEECKLSPRLTIDASISSILIKTFSTVTEPESLPWFPMWSSG